MVGIVPGRIFWLTGMSGTNPDKCERLTELDRWNCAARPWGSGSKDVTGTVKNCDAKSEKPCSSGCPKSKARVVANCQDIFIFASLFDLLIQEACQEPGMGFQQRSEKLKHGRTGLLCCGSQQQAKSY